jgi:hypothetical protein
MRCRVLRGLGCKFDECGFVTVAHQLASIVVQFRHVDRAPRLLIGILPAAFAALGMSEIEEKVAIFYNT